MSVNAKMRTQMVEEDRVTHDIVRRRESRSRDTEIIYRSNSMKSVLELAKRVAP